MVGSPETRTTRANARCFSLLSLPRGLNREQVRERMQKCDVFVLSSLHETFGVVVGEAMACGKPVISTRCGGPVHC